MDPQKRWTAEIPIEERGLSYEEAIFAWMANYQPDVRVLVRGLNEGQGVRLNEPAQSGER